MKKIAKTIVLILLSVFTGISVSDCKAQDYTCATKVKVTNIRNGSGTILIAAGDFEKPKEMAYGMAEAKQTGVECTLFGKVGPGMKIYAIHDENGNLQLDMGEDGKPAEGCFSGIVESDKEGNIVIAMKYYESDNE